MRQPSELELEIAQFQGYIFYEYFKFSLICHFIIVIIYDRFDFGSVVRRTNF